LTGLDLVRAWLGRTREREGKGCGKGEQIYFKLYFFESDRFSKLANRFYTRSEYIFFYNQKLIFFKKLLINTPKTLVKKLDTIKKRQNVSIDPLSFMFVIDWSFKFFK
jgi:hypothetical protein